jgi:hypothetical protein
MTKHFSDMDDYKIDDPARLTRLYLEAQNKVAARTDILVKTLHLLEALKSDICVNRIYDREQLMKRIKMELEYK